MKVTFIIFFLQFPMAIMLIVDGYSLGVALALRIAPGLGYGLI